ncbi:MAG: OmpH family outer membrane protein [Acidobacteria bacterium]|nr:OmpH family outer membrane protein [Acidobacteriota bacterium]
MKFVRLIAIAAATVVAASAQAKVAVINIQAAIANTKDGKKAAEELDARMAPRKKDLEKKQGDINALKDSLQKGGSAMSENSKRELMSNIDTKTKSYNRDLEDAQAELQQEQDKVLGELGQKMMAVIDKYSRDNQYVLVLDVSNPQTPVLFASNTIDITQAIIEMYDKNAPAAGAAGAPSAAKPAPIAPTAAPVKKPAVK